MRWAPKLGKLLWCLPQPFVATVDMPCMLCSSAQSVRPPVFLDCTSCGAKTTQYPPGTILKALPNLITRCTHLPECSECSALALALLASLLPSCTYSYNSSCKLARFAHASSTSAYPPLKECAGFSLSITGLHRATN